jgi:tRNA-Thr(GGU) m(6)t(6)A37 methyltransferase TsaA
MNRITYQPIGIINSPFQDVQGMPIQPSRSKGVEGTVQIYEAYHQGLQDLDGFSHIILLYHFHQVGHSSLTVTPFLDTKPHGVFATRAPTRPNTIGLSIVKLNRIVAGILHIEGVDILDGTPLLDIKPYIPAFDHPAEVKTGWLPGDAGKLEHRLSDGRFQSGHSAAEEDDA